MTTEHLDRKQMRELILSMSAREWFECQKAVIAALPANPSLAGAYAIVDGRVIRAA